MSGRTNREIEQYEHADKSRANNPPVGLVTPKTDPDAGKKRYEYDPHLDPQLVWAGKAEYTSFEVPTVSLHVHERIDPRTVIEAVRKRNGEPLKQLPLFETLQQNPPLRAAIEFYKHSHGWTNRLIAGDSLLVMNSLLEKEGLAGHVQMVYIDPPYGIKYGSNFQPFVNKRDVKDGKLLKAQMNTDLLTDDLKKKRASNESFWLIGQPDVVLREIKKGEHKGKFEVEVNGFDYYNPRTGAIESGDTTKIALWMLDTDYDGRSLLPRQIFFPMSGPKDGWSRLAKTLQAEIDEELIEAYRGTRSLPFEPGENRRVAVKIVDDRGIESLKIIPLE